MRTMASVFCLLIAVCIWGGTILDHSSGGLSTFLTLGELFADFGLCATLPWQWAANAAHFFARMDAGLAFVALALAIPIVHGAATSHHH